MKDADTPVFRQSDVMDAARAQALHATLGLENALKDGDDLPPFFHQIYFWNALPPDLLGRDGHPARGQGPVPDLGLPRRMWAGGRLRFIHPLTLGNPATCSTRLVRSERKQGRTGPLGLVTLEYQYSQNDGLCVTEERDLIYREDPVANAKKPTPPIAPEPIGINKELHFDSTTLFRYSALTFNGHRIHYDGEYARDVEGYSGLVVHGPLLAQLLILFAQDQLGPIKTFAFRATAPLMHFETATAYLNGSEMWIAGPDNRLCMRATVEI